MTATTADGGFTLHYGETTYLSWSSNNSTYFSTNSSEGSIFAIDSESIQGAYAVNVVASNTTNTPRFAKYSSSSSNAGIRWYAAGADGTVAGLYKNCISSIALTVSDDWQKEYSVGDSWSTAGITVTATDINGSPSDVTDNAVITFDPASPTADGNSVTITAAYSGQTATETVTGISVTSRSVQEIAVSTKPQTEFGEGDAFNVDGIVVTVSYDDTTSSTITDPDLLDFSIEPGTALTSLGTQTVTVTYEGFEATYEITVVAQPLLIIDHEFTATDLGGTAQSVDPFDLEDTELGGYSFTPEIVLGEGYSQYYIANSSGTLQIGSQYNRVSSFTLYSEILAGERSLITSIYLYARVSQSGATLSATMNGETVSESMSTSSSLVEYTLDLTGFTNPVGHLEIKIESTTDTGSGIFLDVLRVYALGDEEANEAAAFAAGLEEVDTCDTDTYGDAIADYAELNGNQYVDGILLDDYLSTGDADKTRGLLSVAEKIAAMTTLAGEAEASVLGLFDGDKGTMVIGACILLAAATIGAAAYILIRKKRTA